MWISKNEVYPNNYINIMAKNEKKVNKYTGYFNWCFNSNFSSIMWITLFIVLGVFFNVIGVVLAIVIHFLIWLGIKNSYKSKKQHKHENTIGLYLIVFFGGFFVAVLLGWIVLLVWWAVGFSLTHWYEKRQYVK